MMKGMPHHNEKKKIDPQASELITKPQLGKRLKMCERQVEYLSKAGKIPVIRIGRSVRYCWEHVLEALEKNQTNN